MEKPVQLERLVMMPGERADIVVDFAQLMAEDAARNGIADGQYYLRNFGPDGPFTGFDDNTAAIAALNGFQDASFAINDEGLPDVADPNSTGQVMRFDVDASAPKPDSDFDPNRTLNTTLTDIFNNELNENNADYTRRLGLFEGLDEFGRLQPMLGSVEPVVDEDGQIVNGSTTWSDATTEVIQLDSNGEATEVWEVLNIIRG